MFETAGSQKMWMGFKWAFYLAAIVMLAAPIAPQLGSKADAPAAPTPALDAPRTAASAGTPALIRAAATTPPPSPFSVRSTLSLDSQVEPGDFAWNEESVPEGKLSIVIDIAEEFLYVYRGGIEIGRSSLIFGADDKPTPLGTFKVLEKDKDHVSNLYDAPMPYMLRLTMDGISIHASEVNYNYATHGCIGLPDEFAALLFARAKLGDPVLITKDWLPHVYRAATAAESDKTI